MSHSELHETSETVLEEMLSCPICQLFVRPPVMACFYCQHLFCDKCIKQYLKYGYDGAGHRYERTGPRPCPLCKKEISLENLFEDRKSTNLLYDTSKKCENSGCKMKMRFIDYNEHVSDICQYRKTYCSFKYVGCTWAGIARELLDHQRECKFRILSTTSQKFGEQFKMLQAKISDMDARLKSLKHWITKLVKRYEDIQNINTFLSKAPVDKVFCCVSVQLERVINNYVWSLVSRPFIMFGMGWQLGIEKIARRGHYGLWLRRLFPGDEIVVEQTNSTQSLRTAKYKGPSNIHSRRSEQTSGESTSSSREENYEAMLLAIHAEIQVKTALHEEFSQLPFQTEFNFTHRYSRERFISGFKHGIGAEDKNWNGPNSLVNKDMLVRVNLDVTDLHARRTTFDSTTSSLTTTGSVDSTLSKGRASKRRRMHAH